MSAVRTFIAFDTPDDVKSDMEALQEKLKTSRAKVRWETKEKFHATIKFLGNVDRSVLPLVVSASGTIINQSPCFEIMFQSLGCFPNKKRPRVIWIGCENKDGQLYKLKNALDRVLLPFGFESETREFHPHITLGRVKDAEKNNDLTPMLENLTFEPRRILIDRIMIMKSRLKPDGSEYSILETINLRSPHQI